MLGRGASTGGTTAPPPTLPLVGYAPFTFRRCARAFRGSSGSPSASNLSELVPIERAPSLSSRGTGFASTSFDPSRRASVESQFLGREGFSIRDRYVEFEGYFFVSCKSLEFWKKSFLFTPSSRVEVFFVVKIKNINSTVLLFINHSMIHYNS